MVTSDNRNPGVGQAAALYLAKLPAGEREANQPEVYKFARWYGWERPFSNLMPPHVASYAEQLDVSATDYEKKFKVLRAFFAYAKKAGWSRTNLATHLKTKKGKAGSGIAVRRGSPEAASLSRQRYDELVAELDSLRIKSRELVTAIQQAAADKDFRENAPLDAAREERGHVEGRIKELEETLKAATIIDDRKKAAVKSGVGDNIIINDLASGEELCYKLVDPREVDPLQGKISIASPLGKALFGRNDGDIVEVTVPAGKLCYQIKCIER
jgi:transcription elongation factor GreA